MCEKSTGNLFPTTARAENDECARTYEASSESARTQMGVLGVDERAYGLYPCSLCAHVIF